MNLLVEEAIKKSVAELGLNLDQCFLDIADPQWGTAGRVHEWRNYVPESIQACWLSLGYDARICVLICAEHAASREEWD